MTRTESSRFGASPFGALDLPSRFCRNVEFKNADVAQLVARNLAKVQVAGSNPVVRSGAPHVTKAAGKDGRMAERRGSGLQILLHGFKSRSDLHN